jgi:hypothetical protein
MVKIKARGAVSIQSIDQIIPDQAIPDQTIEFWEASGFQVRDILWMLGMCAVSLGLTPFVAFYLLLVA